MVGDKMPNRAAKDRKRKRMLLNKKLATEGRTAVQHKRWLKNNKNKTTNKYGI
jgi:hypothetical protein|tara:strand:+ start:529 stop:687 length:159 start_codon:yes stop_codon:yes gene_type:complete